MRRASITIAVFCAGCVLASPAGMPALTVSPASLAAWKPAGACSVLFRHSAGATQSIQYIDVSDRGPLLLYAHLPPRESPALGLWAWFEDGTRAEMPLDDGVSPCAVILPHKPLSHILVRTAAPGRDIALHAYAEGTGVTGECDGWTNLSLCQVVPVPVSGELEARPFFLSASQVPKPEDVSLVALMRGEQLLQLELLASLWDGPISAVVALQLDENIAELIAAFIKNAKMRLNVDVHIVLLPPDQFPQQALWKVGLKHCRTSNALFLPHGMVPSSGLNHALAGLKNYMPLSDRDVLFLPAFVLKEKAEVHDLPMTKEQVKSLFSNGRSDFTPIGSTFPVQKWLAADKPFEIAESEAQNLPFVARRSMPILPNWFGDCGFPEDTYIRVLKQSGYKFSASHVGFATKLFAEFESPLCSKMSEDETRITLLKELNAHLADRPLSRLANVRRLEWWDLGNLTLSCGLQDKQVPPIPFLEEKTGATVPAPAPTEEEKQEEEAQQKRDEEKQKEDEKLAAEIASQRDHAQAALDELPQLFGRKKEIEMLLTNSRIANLLHQDKEKAMNVVAMVFYTLTLAIFATAVYQYRQVSSLARRSCLPF